MDSPLCPKWLGHSWGGGRIGEKKVCGRCFSRVAVILTARFLFVDTAGRRTIATYGGHSTGRNGHRRTMHLETAADLRP
ncbi:hypothetical protein NPIL_268331 [Nephila pilipes]|uniref:Uncharacterized protein n=1 Tax=Nephila pilipes TaxID=299642 RepID=A0A8X6P746_NEPPI|nr:hypothetical protein NPIL_268331 [Nephila pilipes]